MKLFKKFSSIVLVLALFLTTFAIGSGAEINVLAVATTDRVNLSEYDQLKADIALIESIGSKDIRDFCDVNKAWIEDVNARLEAYLEKVSDDQKNTVLIDLRGDEPQKAGTTDYFVWESYTPNSKPWATYNMEPKLSTRILRP